MRIYNSIDTEIRKVRIRYSEPIELAYNSRR